MAEESLREKPGGLKTNRAIGKAAVMRWDGDDWYLKPTKEKLTMPHHLSTFRTSGSEPHFQQDRTDFGFDRYEHFNRRY